MSGIPPRTDEGSAVVEFVMVSAVLLVLVLGVIQLALVTHVRNIAQSSASEGARFAAQRDREPSEGAARTTELMGQAFGALDTQVAAGSAQVDGVEMVNVTVTFPMPVVGLWGWGSLTVDAHAVEESPRD